MFDSTTQTRKYIKLSEYDVFCFDLDHTLVKYNVPHTFRVVYNAIAKFIVEERGYDKDMLLPLDKDFDFLTRGLVLDTKKGNFLRLSDDGTILRACHGTKELCKEDIQACYGEDCKWKRAEELIDKTNNLGDEFRIFENFFDIPIAGVCARVIDCVDKKEGKRQEEYSFWSDVMAGAQDTYLYTQFAANLGGYFPVYKKHQAENVYPCSDRLKDWLKGLKARGKKLVLLTSSYVDYAKTTLQFTLGPDAESYFDIMVTFARKPGFFTKENPFLKTENLKENGPADELIEGGCYSQGNYKDLMTFLARVTGKENPKVLYFGDSFRSDMCPTRKYTTWDTVMIMEELSVESSAAKQNILNEVEKSDDVDGEPTAKKPHVTVDTLQVDKDQSEHQLMMSKQWGSFFHHDKHPSLTASDKPTMNTLFSVILRKYADIVIPHIDTITEVVRYEKHWISVEKQHHVQDIPEDDELPTFSPDDVSKFGFYPLPPTILTTSSE